MAASLWRLHLQRKVPAFLLYKLCQTPKYPATISMQHLPSVEVLSSSDKRKSYYEEN